MLSRGTHHAAAVALLVFPVAVLAIGLILLALVRKQAIEWQTLTGAGLFAAGLLSAAIWVRWRLPSADPFLLPIAATLAAVGQLMTSRLEPSLGPRQGLWILIGLGLMTLVGWLPAISWLRRYKYTWATLAILLQLLTLAFGRDPNGSGAALWFVIGPVSVQPTEGVKLLLVVFLAAYLEEYRELLTVAGQRVGRFRLPSFAYLAPILVMFGVVLLLFWLQKDLGPALLFATVLLAMLYVASGRLSYVVIGLILVVLGGALASHLFDHVHTRVLVWLDPWSTRDTLGFQPVQALYAFASGGVFGTGLDMGSPGYIPAVHTDFVIAAIGEELGLAGTLAVVNLYVLLVLRGFVAGLNARSAFSALLAAGLTAVFALQALIILSGTLLLIPLTGITLPFVSYGGSSVVANFLIVGLLLRISHDEHQERVLEELRGNMRRTALVLLAGFGIVALALGYWQVWRAVDLAPDPANPRIAAERLVEPRGRILDRTDQVLADSESTPAGMVRHYADPSLVHTIGFHSARFGDTDLEAAYDAELRGERALSPIDRLAQQFFHRPPEPNDLVLTVDKRIHDAAVQALGTSDGAIVAIDPRSGAVLAMVSKPYFDPNASDDDLARLQSDSGQPLFNRAVQALYVPGSIFKTVTATAALDTKLVDLNQPFMCTTAVKVGTYSVDCKNSQHVPNLTYKQAFAWSSNRVFGLTGMLLGFPRLAPINAWLDDTPPGAYPWTLPGASIQPSANVLEDYARRFGFERTIPFDLPVAVSQVKRPSTEWTPELLVQTAFGQGELQVTPLQMALVASAVANGGRVPMPYVAAELRGGGATRQLHEPGQVFSVAGSSDVANTVVSFMVEGVVDGYAAKAAIPGVKVGGKTGTAEVGDGTSHSWFIGFAPADAPRIAIAVIMEHQGSGSDFATPAAQQVLRAALAIYK